MTHGTSVSASFRGEAERPLSRCLPARRPRTWNAVHTGRHGCLDQRGQPFPALPGQGQAVRGAPAHGSSHRAKFSRARSPLGHVCYVPPVSNLEARGMPRGGHIWLLRPASKTVPTCAALRLISANTSDTHAVSPIDSYDISFPYGAPTDHS